MMKVFHRLAAAGIFILAGCATDATSPLNLLAPTELRLTTGCNPMTAIQPCPDPIGSATRTSWPFIGPYGDVLYEAPGDPSPGAPGIWLGSATSPAVCFNDKNLSIVDADHDWLDDGCEVELARGFAPRWSMGDQDACPNGEPAWAAKYFPGVGVVRLAFMPAYYNDCGEGATVFDFGAGHPGDSEFAMVEVGFNTTTKHWEFRQMWLSAHYTAPGNRSAWVPAAEANFSRRSLAHPYIAVSADKHANFKSEATCNKTFLSQIMEADYCYGSMLSPFRFPIDPSRNAGSRFTDLMGCVPTIKGFNSGGRTECFYTYKPFAGWNSGATGETSYREILLSDKFENRFGDLGPGPNAYTPPPPPPDDGPPLLGGGCPKPGQLICS